MKIQTAELSALLDGELEEHEVRVALQATLHADDMRDAWYLYSLIGDGLRGVPLHPGDMTANVMARVREEPVVLAPRNLTERHRQHPLLALAASLAGVAIVGWLALSGSQGASTADNRLAAAPPAPSIAKVQALPGNNQPKPGVGQVLRGDMNEYLLAHQLQAGTPQLVDSTRQIRTVAMGGGAERP